MGEIAGQDAGLEGLKANLGIDARMTRRSMMGTGVLHAQAPDRQLAQTDSNQVISNEQSQDKEEKLEIRQTWRQDRRNVQVQVRGAQMWLPYISCRASCKPQNGWKTQSKHLYLYLHVPLLTNPAQPLPSLRTTTPSHSPP